MDLTIRPRRLRGSESIRRLCRETRMSPDSLIYPIFVDETLKGKRPISSLSGQFHYGLDAVTEAVEECLAHGWAGASSSACPPERMPRAPPPGQSTVWCRRLSGRSRPFTPIFM